MSEEQNEGSPEVASPPPQLPGAEGQTSSANHKPKIAGVIVFFLVAALIAGVYYVHSLNYVSTDDAFIDAHVVPISPRIAGHVLQVYMQDNEDVASGALLVEIDPRDYEARLAQAKAALQSAASKEEAARVSLSLIRITSSAGVDQTSSGLAQAEHGVQTARASLEAARSLEAQAKAQLEAAKANAQRSRAQVTAAQAEAERASKDEERYRKLVEEGVVARQVYDAASAAAKQANAQLQAAREQAQSDEARLNEAQMALQGARDQVNRAASQQKESEALVGEAAGRLTAADTVSDQMALSEAQLAMAKADVEQARAAVRQAELNLSYARVCAPSNGRVTHKTVEEGAYVQVGQPLMALVPPEVWVVANFKETQLSRMKPGQPVSIKVDAYPGERYRGHVDSIQSGTGASFSLLPPENATGNYVKVVQRVPVKIVFDGAADPDHRLVPGMSVVPKVKVR